MTNPHFWTGENIDHQARGGPTPSPHWQPGDEPGSLRSGDGHTKEFYTIGAGSVKQTAGIRSTDPSVPIVFILVGVFAVLVVVFSCWALDILPWLAAWVLTW